MKDKNRPKSPLSSYGCFVQVIREKHRSLNPNENVIFSEFAKKCAEKWREMAIGQRTSFDEMSRLDIKRYNREMGEYVQQQQQSQQQNQPPHSDLSHGQETTMPAAFGYPIPPATNASHQPQLQQAQQPSGHVRGTKRRRLKDPGMPKRPLSAFFLFSDEQRPRIRAEHPEWRVSELAKEMGRLWEDCPDKEPYETKAKEDKQRYEEEMQLYRQGTFVATTTKRLRVATPSGSAPIFDEEDGTGCVGARGVVAGVMSSFEIEGSREADEMDRKEPDDEDDCEQEDEDEGDDEEEEEDLKEEDAGDEEYEKMAPLPGCSDSADLLRIDAEVGVGHRVDSGVVVGGSYAGGRKSSPTTTHTNNPRMPFSVAYVSGGHGGEDADDDDQQLEVGEEEEDDSGNLVVDEN